MCQFASWIEHRGTVKFLTYDLLHNTRRGKGLQEWSQNIIDDFNGHGAIRWFYGLAPDEGVDRECTDFSTPDNFPSSIVDAIKKGKMRSMGIGLGLLTQQAMDEYEEATQPARDKYQKAAQQAFDECQKARQQAMDECQKARQQAMDKYQKATRQTRDEYEKATWQARILYQKAELQARILYQKAEQQAFWGLFQDIENRNPLWR